MLFCARVFQLCALFPSLISGDIKTGRSVKIAIIVRVCILQIGTTFFPTCSGSPRISGSAREKESGEAGQLCVSPILLTLVCLLSYLASKYPDERMVYVEKLR